MEDVIINFLEKPVLDTPVLIEGLPGVGNVGKIAAEHLIDMLGAVKFATIHSKHLPAQVIVDEEGVAHLVSQELYYHKDGGKDIIFLTGDFQAVNHFGQHTMSMAIIETAIEYNVSWIYTLGGYGVGHFVEKPRVFGSVNQKELLKEFDGTDISFGEGEPGSGIVGASGLLLGLSAMKGMPALCLMGETHGYIADPNSARAVLDILMNILGVTVELDDLDRKASEIERITSQIKDLTDMMDKGSGEEIGYIR